VCFFRDFFTKSLPGFVGIAEKNPRYADNRKKGAGRLAAMARAERGVPLQRKDTWR
jgi:hypothetical protein